jgi:hypothetical protein
MKVMFPAALAAALAFACSHGSSSTRAAGNDTGVTSTNNDATMNGGQTTAGTVASNPTSVPSNGATANNGTPTDSNTASPSNTGPTASTVSNGQTNSGYGSTSTNGTDSSASASNTANSPSGTNPAVGSTTSSGMPAGGSVSASNGTGGQYGSAGAAGTGGTNYSSSGVASVSNGSANGTNAPGAPGSSMNNPTAGAKDDASMKTVTGNVAKIDNGSITLDQAAGGVTLTVDSSTQITRKGKAVSQGISAIHEGAQVRASFDPASNRADKIDLTGMKKKMHHDKDATTAAPQ